MSKKELASILTYYAISPIHAGSGALIGAIDLPIQRERHTNWPHIQASSVKGALRDHFRSYSSIEDRQLINFIFGTDTENDNPPFEMEGSIAGALAASDAKLLAFPVRSNVSPFVWVTCPSVLQRLESDLKFVDNGKEDKKTNWVDISMKLEGEKFVWLINKGDIKIDPILLEDVVLKLKNDIDKKEFITDSVLNLLPDTIDKLLLVSDSIFTYLTETATEVQAQIKIDSKTGTTKDGSLRYQELLPSDTLLYSVIYFKKAMLETNNLRITEDNLKEKIANLTAKTIMETVKKSINKFIQIGGDETLGRGICSIHWYPNSEGGNV
jgi:CRISPR-associated protein Cmr4